MNPKLNHPLILKQVDFSRLILMADFGSTVYGTALPTSDTDFKGIMFPKGRDIVLGRAPSSQNIKTNDSGSGVRNSVDDMDMELYSIYRYLELLGQGQTVALDMLYTPKQHIYMKTGVWDYIQDNKLKLINKKCGAAIGYAKAQANKYSLRGDRMLALEWVVGTLGNKAGFRAYYNPAHQPLSEIVDHVYNIPDDLKSRISPYIKMHSEIAPHLPEGKIDYLEVCGKKAGYTSSIKFALDLFAKDLGEYGDRAKAAKEGGADWKAMYHAVRIAEQTVELLDTGHITFPRPEAPYLLQVRRGERSVEEVSFRIEEGIARIYESQSKSTLQEKTDQKMVDDLIYKMYVEEIVNSREK